MDKTLMAIMGMMFGLVMLVAVADMAQAMGPQLNYCCPICGECFATYDELYEHFTTQHPSEPIDIIWT